MSDEELSLPEMVAKGAAIYDIVEGDGTVDEDKLRDAIHMLRSSLRAIYSQGVFSPNEEKDDISTNLLKYVFPHFYLAHFYQRTYVKKEDGGPDHEERIQNLRQAKLHADAYLSMCHKKGFMNKEDVHIYHREEPCAPQDKRSEKIASFKRDKEVKDRLKALEERRKRLGTKDADEGDDYEDIEREATLALIEMRVRSAMTLLTSIDEEKNMLENVLKMGLDRMEKPKPLTPQDIVTAGLAEISMQQKLGQSREYIQSRIFQPGHNLPTMSIEEFAQIETEQMMENSRKEAETNARKAQEEEDDPDKESDAARMKQREWDAFIDENPRGWGNKMRR